ncbi:MAG: protein translocase subunit SecD [Chloroflexi bacterium]|nr:MAG: protein translocase subunit SecD [Chloroflexota bacterium]
MGKHVRWLIFILALTVFCIWVALPETTGLQTGFNEDGEPQYLFKVQQSLGLDLVGGLRVLLEAELPPDAFTIEDLRETANSVSRRVNALGLTEATVQIQGNNRILVELPGLHDPQQAIEAIQQTALLEFVDFTGLRGYDLEGQHILTTEQLKLLEQRGLDIESASEEAMLNPLTGQPFETVVTGAGLQAASAVFSPTRPNGQPEWHIQFSLKDEVAQEFADFTERATGEPMAIVLDGEVLSTPIINGRLEGTSIITFGQQSLPGESPLETARRLENQARTLALQLRSGALRIPLRVVSAENIGPTLGRENVEPSIRAGVLGVFVVLTFMFVYYRVPGIAADLALIVFILLNLAVFKLIPVTLTLPAITGFLISIGTAVDGNILIFERIKEELRAGNDLDQALQLGFERAWTSIRDSNFSTIIICAILFLFGQTPGAAIVSGFAITLALGLIINLFTAVLVTRTFLYVLVGVLRSSLEKRQWLLGV